MEQILNKKRMWLKRTADFAVGIIFVFLFFLLAMPAEAGNQQITFQGKLTNASGNTVSNGTYYVKLTIYDAATGGSCQYTASSTCASVTSTPVTVTNGIFSINLGDTSAALAAMSSTLFNNSALYLGITVCSGAGTGCDSEMTPRKRITAAPYAFNADYLSGLATSTIGGQGSYVPVTDSSGNFTISNKVFVATTTAGQFGVGTTTVPTGVKSYVEGTTASDKLLVVRGNGSQTGNLQEWQNNAGTALVAVDSSGNVSTSGTLRTFGNIGIAMAPSYPLDVAGFINVDQYSGYKQAGNTILTASSTNVSTLVGSDAGFALKATAQYNTAVGYQALYSTTLSDNNTAIGYLALYSDTSGYNNTANGANSLFSNTTGRNNTASGVQSMLQNTSGDGNTAGGWRSMMNNTTGNSSTAYGAESLNSNTTGYNNTANGFRALYNNTTGADNTSLGFQAGYNSSVSLATLTSSTFVGSNASVSTNGLTNVVVIGSTAQATASNQVVLGNTSITQTLLRGNVGIGYNSPSDKLTVYGGNLRVGDGTVSSTLGTNFFAVATSTTNMNGLFYIDSSGNVSASGTLAAFNNATIGGHIYPSSDNLYDVGASSTQWRYGNFQGGVLIGNGVTSSTFANNSFSLGQRNVTYESGLFRIDSSGNLFTSGTVALTDTSGGVVSSTANFLRLSADGANQLQFWTSASQRMYIDSSGNIFASGTLQSTGNTYFYSNTTFGDAVGDAITITGRLSTLNVSDGSTATSSLANNSLTIGQVLGTFNSGYFNVDLSGNVSASGTLGVFGNATLLGSLSATSNTSSLRSLYLSGLTATPNTLAGTLYFNSADAKFYGYTANGTAVDLGSTGGTNDWGRFSSTYGALALMTSSTYPVWFDGNVYASSTLTVSGTTSASSTVITGTSLVVGRGAGWQGGVFSVDASGNIASSSTLNVAGGPNPAGSVWHPTHKSVLTDSASYNLKGAYSVFVSGNYAYVAANVEDALSIVDVSNPASTTYKGSYSNSTLLDGANSVFVSGNYAYVTADTADTLAIIDISNPANPTLKGSLTDSTNMDNPQSVFVSGNYAYVVGGPQVSGGTLVVIDVSNPTNPILTGVINNGDGGATLRGANYVFVSGKYAYVSANTNGTDALEIVDISNPRSPVHAGKLSDAADNLLNGPTEVFVSGNYAYVVSNGDDGLEIVDISNPANPLHKGSLANGTGGALLLNSESIFVSGNYAYIGADSSAVLEIVDISDPANPVHKSNIVDGSGGASLASPYSVFVSGNYAYVADYSGTSGSLEIVDISGAVISNARIGALNVDTLQINNFAQFDQGILVRSGLNVGGPTQLLGDVSIGGGRATSTNMSGGGLTIFTNQASSTFTSRVLDASNSTGFIFNSGTSTWTGADRNLVSFQTGGTDKFLFAADGSMVVNKGSGSNLGKFYVDSSGNVSASGTLAVFGNSTLGDSDAAGGDTTRAYGSLAMGAAATGNAQLFLKATSTIAVPFLVQDSNSNVIGKLASSTAEGLANGAQVTVTDYSLLTVGDAAGLTGAVSLRSNRSSGALVIYRNATAIGTQLTAGTLIMSGDGSVTSTLGNSTFTLSQDSTANSGRFYIDSNGNTSASGTLRVFSSISGGGLQISATSATTTFTSYVTDSVGATAFEFMSSVIMTSGTDRALAVFRNGDSAGRNKVVISAAGNVYAAQGFIAGSSNYGIGDVAEYVNLVAGEIGEPGDVLVVDKINYNQYKKSSAPNTKEVAGVISDTGAFIMGASGPGRASLALAGLVKVKITDENGPVAVGDYLTTASKPGYAMRFDADAGISAGLVGMALEPWESGDGKITILVNKGLAVGNAAVSTLNASENGAGQLVWGNDLNLHLSGRSILDVLSIKSQDEKWVIDEEGYLVVKVETQQGDKMLYGLQSGQDKEVVFSGSSQLEDGVKEIELPTIDKEIIDLEAPIKVSVTLTGEANGVFVTDKSYEGFTVKELNSGASDATFDWMVIAKRRAVGDESVENDEVVEDVESVEENSGDIIIDAEALPEEIITPEVSETSEELALETTEDVPPEVDVTIVEELIPDSGEDTASSTPAESASE